MSGHRETSPEDSDLGTGSPLAGVERTRGVTSRAGPLESAVLGGTEGRRVTEELLSQTETRQLEQHISPPRVKQRRLSPSSPTDEWSGRGVREYRDSRWKPTILEVFVTVGAPTKSPDRSTLG